jgi:TolB-like protein/Tfp pilus assembly protein PilF
MSSLFSELKRRNVFRVAILYGVVSWLILQVSDIAMPALGLPDWSITLVLYFLAVGLPIALIFAWAFELTPEGLKRTKEVDPGTSVTPVTGQKINNLIIGVLSIALVFVIIHSYVLKDDNVPVEDPATAAQDTTTPEQEPAARPAVEPTAKPVLTSIAVLPFADMSPAKDQEYFTDGISEELLNLLAKIPDFKVAGRTSSFAFKGKNEDLRGIGEKLGVATILEGSVRKQKDKIRVTAQLIKVDDGYHLWSETYDRQLDDVFAIQDEIATEVVGALKQTLLGEEDRAVLASVRTTSNTEAYASYLRGKHMIKDRTSEGLYKALREFRHATDVDPGFAPAWAGMANAYSLLGNYGFRPNDEVLPLAREAVDKALAIDPELGEAWAAQGLLYMEEEAPTEDQLVALEKAVALNPSDATARMWLSTAMTSAGLKRKAMDVLRDAYAIDPLNPTLLFNLSVREGFSGRPDDANRYALELEEVRPDWDGTYRLKMQLANIQGEWVDELRWAKKALELDPDNVGTLMQIANRYLDFSDWDKARDYAARAREVNPLAGNAIALQADYRFNHGDADGAWGLINRTIEKIPTDSALLAQAGWMALHEGRPEDALEYLERIIPRRSDGEGWALESIDRLFGADQQVLAYRQAGKPDDAEDLRRQCSMLLDSLDADATWRVPYARAQFAAAAGDRVEALTQLRVAVEKNGVADYFDDKFSSFADYLDDPEIGPLIDTMVARRDRFAQLAASKNL